MKTNKTNVVVFLLLLSFFIPLVVLGVDSPEDVEKVLKNIARWLYRFFIVVTVIFFILAGFTYLTASGDPNKIDKATKMIKFGVIGAIVALLATSVIPLLESVLDV